MTCAALIATNRPGMPLPPVEEVRRPKAVAAAEETTPEPPAKRRRKSAASTSSAHGADGSLLKKTSEKGAAKLSLRLVMA